MRSYTYGVYKHPYRTERIIRRFFRRRSRYESELYPRFKSTMMEGEEKGDNNVGLDVAVAASGFSKKGKEYSGRGIVPLLQGLLIAKC